MARPQQSDATLHQPAAPSFPPENESLEQSSQLFAESAHEESDANLRHRMISETGYHLSVANS